MVFPAVFALMETPEVAATTAGAGLTFVVLPEVFANFPFGPSLFSFLFFLLLFCGAATSAMSLLEAATAFAVEKFKMTRIHAVWVMGAIILLLGGYSALSLSGDPKITFTTFAGAPKTLDFFDFMDEFCNNVMLPFGSMFLCIFIGWFWFNPAVKELTNDGSNKMHWLGIPWLPIWAFCVKVVAPIGILVVGLAGLGILDIILKTLGLSN
jgi:NSS family neurotransmitter:Na+ symporter